MIKVTHEFVDDPEGVRRAYETWALLLARSLNMEAPVAVRPPRRQSRKQA